MSERESSPPPGLQHRREIEVFWGDCDAAGVVFYPRYYAWFDANTHAMLSAAGLDHHHLRATFGVLGTPLVKASASFASPATYGDVLEARCEVVHVGTKSFRVRHRLSVGARPVVEGEEVRVWAREAPSIDGMPGMQTEQIPAAVVEILRGGRKPT